MKNLIREVNIKLNVHYPEGYASEAMGDIEDLEERMKLWVAREVSSVNEKNKVTNYHQDIKLEIEVS